MDTTMQNQLTNKTEIDIATKYRGLILNAEDVGQNVDNLLMQQKVDEALLLFQNRADEVDEAIAEYHPQTHSVMQRPNKPRKNDRPYITEKLPRSRQKYINEVELFFMLGKPLRWQLDKGDPEAYELFTEFLESVFYTSKMRQIKRLAGSETECAKLYHLYNQNGVSGVNMVILARSTGYDIRPLFNQYGVLVAFAYGCNIKTASGQVDTTWTIETADYIYTCLRDKLEWNVNRRPNPTKRINVIYYRQPKAWDGVEPRMVREEMLDSKQADTNNYFADPVAKATADVIQSLASPETTGKLIQLNGANSSFDYVNPPQSSESRRSEQERLEKSILFDTFTPDFSFENLRGFGTVSGAAIRNAMTLGFLKASNLEEVYTELINRDIHLIKAILQYQHPEKSAAIEALKISFEYSEPFATEDQTQKDFVIRAYQAGLCSLQTAVTALSLTKDTEAEIARIKEEKAQAAAQQQSTGDKGKEQKKVE